MKRKWLVSGLLALVFVSLTTGVFTKDREFAYEPQPEGMRDRPEMMELVDVMLRDTIIAYLMRKKQPYTDRFDKPNASRKNDYIKHGSVRPFCDYKTYGTLDNGQIIIGYISYFCEVYSKGNGDIDFENASGNYIVIYIDRTKQEIIDWEQPDARWWEEEYDRLFPEDIQEELQNDSPHKILEMRQKLKQQAEAFFASQ